MLSARGARSAFSILSIKLRIHRKGIFFWGGDCETPPLRLRRRNNNHALQARVRKWGS